MMTISIFHGVRKMTVISIFQGVSENDDDFHFHGVRKMMVISIFHGVRKMMVCKKDDVYFLHGLRRKRKMMCRAGGARNRTVVQFNLK